MYGIEADLFISLVVQVSTICPRSSYPLFILSYYIEWVTTSWIHSKAIFNKARKFQKQY